MHRPIFSIFLTLVLATSVQAQSNIENPLNNSKQSGVGLVSGWKCSGTNLTAVIDGIFTLALTYGSQRNDTQEPCGDTNNGFGLLVNWNLLTNGAHTIRFYDNGLEFASSTFTVQTLGQQFYMGLSKSVNVPNFPSSGLTTQLEWQESSQNFVIAGLSTGGVTADLEDLLGTWEFRTTVGSLIIADHYRLQSIQIVSGKEVIAGTDLDQGDSVIGARIEDLLTDPFPFTFALLDKGIIICDLFVFDSTGEGRVIGADIIFDVVGGECGNIIGNTLSPMGGNRTSSALRQTQTQALLKMGEEFKTETLRSNFTAPEETIEVSGMTQESLHRLIGALQALGQ